MDITLFFSYDNIYGILCSKPDRDFTFVNYEKIL